MIDICAQANNFYKQARVVFESLDQIITKETFFKYQNMISQRIVPFAHHFALQHFLLTSELVSKEQVEAGVGRMLLCNNIYIDSFWFKKFEHCH